MSKIRQRPLTVEEEPFLTVRSLAQEFTSGYVIEPHTHPWHQFLYATSGAMTLLAGNSSWMVPPGKAVLIPARCSHTIRMWGTVAMRSLYFVPTLESPVLESRECRVVSVTPLLRELILRVVERTALDCRVAGDERLLAVLLDEMNAAPLLPLLLPMPTDERALAVARHVLASPAGEETVDTLSRKYGAARRTLERLFQQETGISLGLWRQKARLLGSFRILAEGRPVTEAALESGYSSMSAFIAAFKQTFGFTPGKTAAE